MIGSKRFWGLLVLVGAKDQGDDLLALAVVVFFHEATHHHFQLLIHGLELSVFEAEGISEGEMILREKIGLSLLFMPLEGR
jgi:hypothetical protein